MVFDAVYSLLQITYHALIIMLSSMLFRPNFCQMLQSQCFVRIKASILPFVNDAP